MATPGTTVQNKVASLGPSAARADRKKLEIADELVRLGANIAPLTRMSRMTGKKAVGNQKYTILEDGDRPRTDTTNGGTLTAGTVTLTLSNASRWRIGDVWQNTRTGEEVLVTGTPSGTTRTVVRGYEDVNSGTGIALVDGDKWFRTGNASAEKSNAPAALITKTEQRDNYAQYQRETTNITEIMSNTDTYGPDEVKRQRENTRREFMIGVESSFLFGKRLLDDESSSPLDSTSGIDSRAKTGGLMYWIDQDASSNAFDASGSLSLLDLWDIIAQITKDAPDNEGNGETELICLAGTRATAVLNSLAMDKVRLESNQNEFGFNIQKLTTAGGTIAVKQHRLIDDYFDNGNFMFLVHPKYVGYRHMRNMDMALKLLIGPDEPASDGESVIKEEISGVIGFYLTLAQVHGYIKNVDFAA